MTDPCTPAHLAMPSGLCQCVRPWGAAPVPGGKEGQGEGRPGGMSPGSQPPSRTAAGPLSQQRAIPWPGLQPWAPRALQSVPSPEQPSLTAGTTLIRPLLGFPGRPSPPARTKSISQPLWLWAAFTQHPGKRERRARGVSGKQGRPLQNTQGGLCVCDSSGVPVCRVGGTSLGTYQFGEVVRLGEDRAGFPEKSKGGICSCVRFGNGPHPLRRTAGVADPSPGLARRGAAPLLTFYPAPAPWGAPVCIVL